MTGAELRLERLGSQHVLAEFDSGNGELDTWLKRHALAAQQMDSARTFVLVEDGKVLGYFSLTMGSVLRAGAPGKLVRGLPSYPVGMVLLARLAVDKTSQGRGLSPPARPPPLGWSWSTPSTNARLSSVHATALSPPLSKPLGSTGG